VRQLLPRSSTKYLAPLAGAALAVSAWAAAGAPANAATPHAAKPKAMAVPKVEVEIATVGKYGKVLVDQKRLALYYDTANNPPAHWACTGVCLHIWPPLVLPKGQARPIAGPGVTDLGVIRGPAGLQVTWHGRPLYTYIRDSAGKIFGQGILHIWWVAQLNAPLKPLTKAVPASKPATSPTKVAAKTSTTTKSSSTSSGY
jgi:predicted lipoprotein with Yx(FWY)xxD motif